MYLKKLGLSSTLFRLFSIASAFIFLAGLPLVGQQDKSKPSQHKAETGNSREQPQPPPAAVEIHGSTTMVTCAPEPKEQTAKAEPKPFLTHGEWVMAILTAIYVTISFFGLMAIKYQGRIMRENVSHLERPWVLVRILEDRGLPLLVNEQWHKAQPIGYGAEGHIGVTPFDRDELERGDYPVKFTYVAKNYGRSPGSMVYHWAKLKMLSVGEKLSEKPDYRAENPLFDMPETRFMEPRRSFRNWFHISLSDFIAMHEHTKFMYVYGYMTYRDAFGEEHVTGFSFHYHVAEPIDRSPTGFYPEPREYNYEK